MEFDYHGKGGKSTTVYLVVPVILYESFESSMVSLLEKLHDKACNVRETEFDFLKSMRWRRYIAR